MFSLFVLMGFSVSAKTLREMAQNSNLLLVLSDRVDADGDKEIKKRSCGMSHEQISLRSQTLKSLIDEKIDSLNDRDYQILEKRAATCELDCTCDIYALAFEKKEKPNELLEKKASQMTPEMRAKCTAKIKNLCQRAKS